MTTYSFFPTKNMTTAEGGAVASPHDEIVLAARRFRSHGLIRDPAELRYRDEGNWHQEVHTFGLNYRLPDVLCALGSAQLRRLGTFVARRAELVARYHQLLADVGGLALPVQHPDVEPAWHRSPCGSLTAADVRCTRNACGRHRSAGQLHPGVLAPVFEDMGYRRGMCPNAETYYQQELSLPLFPDLTDAQQEMVVDALRTALG